MSQEASACLHTDSSGDMLKTVLTPEKLWPDGIPSSVRLHPDGGLSEDDMKEESKGWCQFPEEEWIPKTDLNEEMQQRRALIERWASADQKFRDSYQERAPLRKSAFDYPPLLLDEGHVPVKRFICLAEVDKEHHPENYIRLVKLLILLYIHDNNGCQCHPMSFEHCESPHIPDLLVDSSTTSDYISFFSQEHLLTNMFLHPADFRVVSMTSSGTVIFNNDDYAGGRAEEFIVIDQDSLNTGRVAVITFKCNGDFREHAILLPWTLTPIVSERKIRGRFYEEILSIEEGYWIYDRLNKPLNLDEPLLDIVNCAMQRRDITGSNYSLADWEDELRRFAPGYLELEAQGQAIEFDLANLWTDGYEGYAHLPEEWKMRMRILGHH